MTHVKVCGVKDPGQARACVELGVRSIGVNFVAGSPRRIEAARAAEIAAAAREVRPDVVVVGVVADASEAELRALIEAATLDCLQLHGDEPPEALVPFLPHAYKALRIASEADVREAARYPGEHLLVDAKVAGSLGGTGHTFDWRLVRELAKTRRLTLAGGLTPENVAEAVALVRPYCVDVASGVERAPGDKDLARVEAFLRRVQAGSSASP